MSDANRRALQPSGEPERPVVPHAQPLGVAHDRYGSYGYGSEPQDEQGDLAQTILWFWHLVLKRRWLVLGALMSCVVLGALITFMQIPLYTATVRLQIEREAAKIVDGADVTPNESGGASLEFMKTQFELLQSRSMAERVVSSLQLAGDEDFLKPQVSLVSVVVGLLRGGPEKGNARPERTATNRVLDNLTVRPLPGSRLVDVSFSDPNPTRAQRIANAYGEAFIALTLDKRFDAKSYARTFLEDQIKQLRIRVEEAEKALVDFAQSEQIVEVADRATMAENNLAAANASMQVLATERLRAEQQWRQVEGSDALSLPQLLSNSVIDGLRQRRNTLVQEYEEKLETFKPAFPAMVQLSNRIKEIDRQLAIEVKTIRDALKAAYDNGIKLEEQMKERVAALQAETLDLQKRMIQYNFLKREVDTNRGIYNSLLQRYKEVDVAAGVTTNNVFIVDRATAPEAPSSPRLSRALLLSFALGLGLGLGSAYLLEILDDRVKYPEELEQLTGLANLGVIPIGEDGDAEAMEEVLDPRSAMAEAYRSLATSLQFSTDTGLPKSLAITSSGPGEGKSTTSIALARHFATLGLKVLLIDGDMRRPSLHIKLQKDNAVGLSNYLTGAANPQDVIQQTDHRNLAVIFSGPMPPNAADLLAGPRLYSLMTITLEVFDLVIVDAPPLLGLADAQLLSSATAATTFVVASGEQRKGMIRAALKRLQMARGRVIGTVMTKYDASIAGYGYGSGYGYGYGYGRDALTYGGSTGDEGGRKRLETSTG